MANQPEPSTVGRRPKKTGILTETNSRNTKTRVTKQPEEVSKYLKKRLFRSEEHNIYLKRRLDLNEEQREFVEDYFKDHMFLSCNRYYW